MKLDSLLYTILQCSCNLIFIWLLSKFNFRYLGKVFVVKFYYEFSCYNVLYIHDIHVYFFLIRNPYWSS